jgi:hypothetical protein
MVHSEASPEPSRYTGAEAVPKLPVYLECPQLRNPE